MYFLPRYLLSAFLVLIAGEASANPCALIRIEEGQIVMLDPPEAIALANQCRAAELPNAPRPEDPCDVRLHFGLEAAMANPAIGRERMERCIADLEATLEARRHTVTPLHEAITLGEPADRVAAILEESHQEFLHVFDRKGMTPLHTAIEHRAHPAVVEVLLSAGADPNARTGETASAFRYAVRMKAPFETLLMMIAAGADPTETVMQKSIPRDLEMSIFHDAVGAGYTLPELRQLFALAGLDRLDYMRRLYIRAIGHPDPAVFDYVLEVSAPPDDVYEMTELLFWAVEEDAHPQVITKLFDMGADRSADAHNSNGRSMLHQAIRNDSKLETIRALIENGATMGDEVPMDYALMVAASSHPDPEVLRYLAGLGFSKSVHQNFKTPVYYARRSSAGNAQAKVDVLLELGFVEEFICGFQCPGVLDAVWRDRPVADIQKVLEGGADIHSVNHRGNGVLHVAVEFSSSPQQVIAFLSEAGADPDLRNKEGDTPLTLALERLLTQRDASAAPALALLQNGADPNIAGASGDAPIFLALRTEGEAKLVAALTGAGADMSVTDQDGLTPLFRLLTTPPAEIGPSYLTALLGAEHPVELTDGAGNTALQAAIKTLGNARFRGAEARAFMSAGYDPNATDAEGDAALHLAARAGLSEPVFAALLAAGADPQARSRDGALPVTLLKANRQMRRDRSADYRAAVATLRRNGGRTNVFRELHYRGWTPWFAGGGGLLLLLGIGVWRISRPQRIV